ncbi:CopL family metal-binding regulatory protein [Lysobacter sp. CW239]|uniref:CopL family metal-binding regulatory protein n=1 Tax=Novilysobacter ciconiae TaxID=2781022 RepID=A0A7S6UDU0_9GAMM|nr:MULTISPECIES: CopL family metal-binding regulatory protein [Lysobacter]QOD89996.1 CopL family metal-binding regulatory protein [Lysobacter sp. CW239]QOW18457.1 CopL family metal-binding regulatory protein [Lysobacter ciconiae]
MRHLPLLLRCLIVLAFCLDGTAMAWQKSAMAAGAVHHGHAATGGHEAAGHGPDMDTVAVLDQDHADTTAPVPTDAMHEDCDCSETGCDCACGFGTFALARGIPHVDTLWIGFVPVSGDLTAARKGVASSLFRPPIG